MKICKHNDGLGRCGISGEYCVEGPCHCEELIEYEPVRHGRWEMRSWNGALAPFCTVCNTVPRWPFHRTTFCPNCGAKMTLENELNIN